jgi:hypothetical protein
MKTMDDLEERLSSLLARIDYKPGYRLRIESQPTYVNVVGTSRKPDATRWRQHDEHQQRMIEIFTAISFERYQGMVENERALLEQIFQMLVSEETHEVQEWFRVDGRHYRHPHPGVCCPPEVQWSPAGFRPTPSPHLEVVFDLDKVAMEKVFDLALRPIRKKR